MAGTNAESWQKTMESTEVHQKALDDLVNVNSLFTLAVFVGLSFASPDQQSLEDKPGCDPDPVMKMKLVYYEVVSFACFLLSSLVAKTLKVHLNIYHNNYIKTRWHLRWGRLVLLHLSALASIIGIIFLNLSMANVIQIRLGKLSCGSYYARLSVASLFAIVGLALCIYLSMFHAIWMSLSYMD